MNVQHMINIDKNVKPIDPESVTQLRLRDGTCMPQAAMGTFHSDNPDLMETLEAKLKEII